MGEPKGGKKGKKKPPKLPGKPPPKDDKAATEKYNALADFVDCKGNTVTLKAGKLDWLGLDIAPDATFEADKNKPGTINIKADLGIGKITLPATVKDGKLDVDTSGLPVGADKVKKFVDDLNDWFEANGRKIDGATIKDGAMTVTKAAVAAAPGKAEEKKEGVKADPFPHVPTWGKAGAGVLLGAAILFGVGFMNAGDETETTAEPTNATEGTTDTAEPAPVPAGGLAEQIINVGVTFNGESTPGTLSTGSDPTQVSFEIPLFQIGEPHEVELQDSKRRVVDRFTFVVPEESGEAPPETTDQGGQVTCVVDHEMPVPPGRSGARCRYMQPAVSSAPEPAPEESAPETSGADSTETVESEETTDGKPWSLLLIPGALLLAGGGLYVRENQLIGEDFDSGLPLPQVPTSKETKAKSDAAKEKWKAEHDVAVKEVLDQVKDVNIGKTLFTDGYTSGNCSFVAICTDSTLGGKPVSAPPRPLHPTGLDWWRDTATEKWGVQPSVYNSADDVAKAVEYWGDGQRGILLMFPLGGHAGHAINVINKGGHVLFIDAQQGIEFTNFGPYKQFQLIKTTK